MPTTKGVATLACVAEGETCDDDRLLDADHRGQGLPGRPERGVPERRREHLGQAREAGEVGRVRAQQGRQAHDARSPRPSRARPARTPAPPSSLGKLDVSPADALLNAQLVAALKTAGGAYKKAAAEGTRKDRAGYKREGAKAARRRARTWHAALDGLANAGYTLPASLTKGAASFTRLPTLIKDKPKSEADVLVLLVVVLVRPRRRHDDAADRRRRRPNARRSSTRTPQTAPTPKTTAAADSGLRRRRRLAQRPRHRRRRSELARRVQALPRSLRASPSRSW